MENGVVLYIGGFELPDKNAAAHRVLSNAKIFRKLGKKVVFIGVDKSLPLDSDIMKTHMEVQGFEAYAVPYPQGSKSWIKYLTNIADYIQVCNKLGKIEMMILYNFQAIAMKKLMFFCEKNAIKCCADVTEWRSAKGEGIIYRILKDSDTWYRMRILHKKLDGLIVISKYLENYYRTCKNVVYIPVLVDCSEEKWTNSYPKSKSQLKIVYAGNPGRKDRLDKLIEALDNVQREYLLDVIGITAEQYLKYYPQHTDLIHSNNKIVFHGRLSHLETLDYIKRANYSCFFRENDRVSKAGFPTKFAEAITSGTPVITNQTSDLKEFIKNDKNGYLIELTEINSMEKYFESVPYVIDIEKLQFDYHTYISSVEKFMNEIR